MHTSFKKVLFIFSYLSIAVLLSSTPLLSENINGLRETIRTHETDISSLTTEMAGMEKRLGTLMSRVDALKEKQSRGYNLFREFELTKLLKQAQVITRDISSLGEKRAHLEKEVTEKRRALLSELEARIETLLRGIRRGDKEKEKNLADLKAVLLERSQLTSLFDRPAKRGKDYFAIEECDSSNDLAQKIEILVDYKARLEKELGLIDERITFLKRQDRAISEVSRLLDEEHFFGETGFLKTAQKSDVLKGKDGLSAKSMNENLTAAPVSTPSPTSGTIQQPASDPTSPAQELPPPSIQNGQDPRLDPKLVMGRDTILSKEASPTGTSPPKDETEEQDGNRSKAVSLPVMSIPVEIRALEEAREDLKRLIGEVSAKHGRMTEEAGRLRILKAL